MKKFRIHVITNHGQGKEFVSEITLLDEFKMDELRRQFAKAHILDSFEMKGENGEIYFFPADLCYTAVFVIVPERD